MKSQPPSASNRARRRTRASPLSLGGSLWAALVDHLIALGAAPLAARCRTEPLRGAVVEPPVWGEPLCKGFLPKGKGTTLPFCIFPPKRKGTTLPFGTFLSDLPGPWFPLWPLWPLRFSHRAQLPKNT